MNFGTELYGIMGILLGSEKKLHRETWTGLAEKNCTGNLLQPIPHCVR